LDSIQIDGGIPLQGQVRIQGSKNAALPILAATILIHGKSYIDNCPKITDIFQMQTLLESIGCKTTWEGNSLKVDASEVFDSRLPKEAVKSMRSSISLLGPLLGRNREAYIYQPGGCIIGERPIDLHIHAMKCLGVDFEEENEMLHATCKRLVGADIDLKFPSVGATENAIMASVLAKGYTQIYPAAREPEIMALCDFLNRAGAIIEGAGTDRILIKGVDKLQETCFRVPADRIVAGTYLIGCMVTGGSVFLKEAPIDRMRAEINIAERMGLIFQETAEGLFIQAPELVRTPGHIITDIYPGFSTDMQSAFLVAMAVAQGDSILTENIFENRFHIADELKKMGANIQIQDRSAYIKGVGKLNGANVRGEELRGTAALIVAGLKATGHTCVTGCEYVYRGYENIGRDLRELGARVYSI